MAFGVIATMKVQEGKNAEFEAVFTKLAEQVLANEKGAEFYALHRSKTDPQEYKVLERYTSMDDMKAHSKTDYFIEANKVLVSMVAAAPDIEVLDAV
jgi:quinol monooxygenase YgiN